MKRRLTSISRILAIQTELHRLAEQKLQMAKRRQAELVEERKELLEALNDDDVFYGSFIYPMAKRLRLLDEADSRVNREIAERSRKVLDQAVRKRGAERLAAKVKSQWDREEGNRELLQLVEKAATAKSSLP